MDNEHPLYLGYDLAYECFFFQKNHLFPHYYKVLMM